MSTAVSHSEDVRHHPGKQEVRPDTARVRPRSNIGRIARMTIFEFGMILRQKVALISIALAPALAIAMVLMSRPSSDAAWATQLASMSVLVLILAVFNTTTSTVVARRETQVLKRLRTSELLPGQMLTTLSLPYVVVGVLQVAVVAVAYQVMGAPMPTHPWAFLAVVLGSAVLAVLAGFATSAFAATSERVQFAVLPIMLIGLVAAIFVLNPGASDLYRSIALLLPFAACSALAARAAGVPVDSIALPSFVNELSDAMGIAPHLVMAIGEVALTVLWCIAFALVARRRWRWEPRG